MVDNRTSARGILDMFPDLGLAQELVEGQGCAIAGRGLQQDLVPARVRETYPGGRGMGCDYNIIGNSGKIDLILVLFLITAKNSLRNIVEEEAAGHRADAAGEVTNRVIMVMFCPRAAQDLVPP